VEVESKLMLASRFDFPSASLASTSAKAPLLNTLSISLNLAFRDIELSVLPHQVQLLLELLSLAVYVLAKNTAVPRVL
jgi:hypothetical protein